MRVFCVGCCVEYHNSKPPIHRKCDIKGSFTDDLPIIIEKPSNDTPPVEGLVNFRIYENSTIGKPAAGFGFRQFYHKSLKQIVTRPILNNYEGPYDLIAFLQFTNGKMNLRVGHFLEFFSGGKLLSAGITIRKG
jgi:hypothetical protein